MMVSPATGLTSAALTGFPSLPTAALGLGFSTVSYAPAPTSASTSTMMISFFLLFLAAGASALASGGVPVVVGIRGAISGTSGEGGCGGCWGVGRGACHRGVEHDHLDSPVAPPVGHRVVGRDRAGVGVADRLQVSRVEPV